MTDAKTTLLPIQVEVMSIADDEIGYISPRVEHRAEPFEDDVLQLETAHRPLKEFEPIVLTTEIAEKCGFVQTGLASDDGSVSKMDYWFHDCRLQFAKDNIHLERQRAGDQPEFIGRVQFLHQLQNLYHALSGEELQIDA